ncbi:MAG: hypothetical protein ABJ314_02970, partial [Ilumatobacter sp.]
PVPAVHLAAATVITSVTSYDPITNDGTSGNGEENDDLLSRLTDGDTSTAWRTQCYSNQFMGAKPGVGVIVSFDAPLQNDLEVVVENGPYNIEFYASSSDTPPATLDEWGAPFDTSFGPDGQTVTATAAGSDADHVLVHILELGRNDVCSDDNPFSEAISEISIS